MHHVSLAMALSSFVLCLMALDAKAPRLRLLLTLGAAVLTAGYPLMMEHFVSLEATRFCLICLVTWRMPGLNRLARLGRNL